MEDEITALKKNVTWEKCVRQEVRKPWVASGFSPLSIMQMDQLNDIKLSLLQRDIHKPME